MFFRFPAPFGFLYLLWKLLLVYLLRLRLTVDATPLSCDNIRGSHGRFPDDAKYKPVLITNQSVVGGGGGGSGGGGSRSALASASKKKKKTPSSAGADAVPAEDIYNIIYDILTSCE